MTLVELVGVVIVLGIMLGVAIPMYTRTIDRGYWRTARDILETIYQGERAYYYTQPAATRSYSTVWDTIFMDNPNVPSIRVTFSIGNVTGAGSTATFTATAARQGTGRTETMTVNQAHLWCTNQTTNPEACGTWPKP